MPKFAVTMLVTEEFRAVIDAPNEQLAMAKLEDLRCQGSVDDYFFTTPDVEHDAERLEDDSDDVPDEVVLEDDAEDLRANYDWMCG
jgi:hypothetical protein